MEIIEIGEPAFQGAQAIARGDESPSTGEMVLRARAGDLDAYEAIYHRHAGRIHSLCLRLTASAERAEDLTQETFVRAWERLRSFRGRNEFPAWLRRVAINVILDDRRVEGRRQRKERETVQASGPAVRMPQARPESSLDLEQAVARLPRRARTVFVLHDVEGHKHEEISQILQISTGTSKAQLHRARKLLREALR